MNGQSHSRSNATSLWSALRDGGARGDRYLMGRDGKVSLADLTRNTALYSRGEFLRGQSVLLATSSQLTTATALIELDGIASRIVLCPPELPVEHLTYLIETAEIDVIVSDRLVAGVPDSRRMTFFPCSKRLVPTEMERGEEESTEWVLLTSGTTGLPKLVAHTLSTLTAGIGSSLHSMDVPTWSTFYDIRRFGGLQIFLRAMLSGSTMVLSETNEPVADFLWRAVHSGVTHISGTPSHWRHALMSTAAALITPSYVRLSGEIADQAILNQLDTAYPDAQIVHAFASTEAGLAFEVHDKMAGFPMNVLDNTPGVDLKVEDGSLRIRSERNAHRYLGTLAPLMKCADGFIDTNDIVKLSNGRVHFAGRRDGVINIGGLKAHPEEIESVINRHPSVFISVVRMKKSPITGAVVVADVVLRPVPEVMNQDQDALQQDILMFCRNSLTAYKVPASIRFIPHIAMAESGKVMRAYA
jgi:acyl-coenzyme A synthetase/AMP-(fatty) acid ligase